MTISQKESEPTGLSRIATGAEIERSPYFLDFSIK